MPSLEALAEIPTVGTQPIGVHAGSGPRSDNRPLTGGAGDTALPAATIANLLPSANPGLSPATAGVYIGEGLAPIPPALAAKIRRGAFVDMGELLPEFWAVSREEDSNMKTDARSRKVTDIFTWLQCYGTYVSVLAPLYPEHVPELMAYMTTIIRASQDYAGLAWVRYDSAFRRQAALTGNTRWSTVNATLYTISFTAAAKTTNRCELCFATSHTEKECAQQGHPDPGVLDQMKAVEKAVLALTSKPTPENRYASRPLREPSGEPCRLWNRSTCTYPKCRHSHVCSGCGGNHPIRACPNPGPSQGCTLQYPPGRMPQFRAPPWAPGPLSQGPPRPY